MSRRVAALKPQLNRIRAWAHEGSTDAWIAHQLETTAESIRAFRQEHGIERGGPAPLAPITPDSVVEAMLAEEAAALEAGPEPEPAEAEVVAEEPAESPPARTPRRRAPRRAAEGAVDVPEVEGPEIAAPASPDASGEVPAEAEAPAKSSRRRGTRGGAGRSAAATASEEPAAAEDDEEPQAEAESASDAPANEEPARTGNRKRGRRRGRGRGGSRGLEARLLTGSVLLLDPSVTGDATFQEHWQNAGPLRVEVSTDAIVLRRILSDPEPEQAEG